MVSVTAYSSNAVMAKCRSIYGKRLRKQDYDSLVACHSINELVSYLKTRTSYSVTFENANSNMSSFQVEELLKTDMLEVFSRIRRYDTSSDADFYDYLVMKNEVQQILRFLHLFIIGTPEEYLTVVPAFLNKRTKVDLIGLASVRKFSDLIGLLKGTGYEEALKPFEQSYNQPECYIQMESALNRILWDYQKKIVSKYKGSERKEIEELISYENDMENLVKIYRLKRLADADEKVIQKYINTYFTHFSEKDIKRMLEKDTAREMLIAASDTYYKKCFQKTELTTLEDFTGRVIYDKLHKKIRYSTNPASVMVCFCFLKQNEVNNIIHIAEGIRNKMSPQAIESVLIGTEN